MVKTARRGLVVSARWLALGSGREYIAEAAESVASALFDPALGACTPALDGIRVLRDPTRAELGARMREAFAAASDSLALLVICLVGHGYLPGSAGPFYFLPSDHPGHFDSADRDGYPLAQNILALSRAHQDIDGLILLVDACRSGSLWRPETRHWSLPLARFAMATATGAGPAWSARFSHAVGEGMESGIAQAGHRLKVGDFRPLTVRSESGSPATAQTPHFYSHQDSNDDGLWVSANRAASTHFVEALVWRATNNRGLHRITDRYQRPEIPDRISDALAAYRALAVLGPSGCGKSATLQMIAIDGLDPSRVGVTPAARLSGPGTIVFDDMADLPALLAALPLSLKGEREG